MSSPSSEQQTAPAESRLLKETQRRSGLSVPELAAVTDLSPATIHIALNGVRYRGGVGLSSAPTDTTLVRLASALGVSSAQIRELGRERAADMLASIEEAGGRAALLSAEEETAVAASSARAALALQVLKAFSTAELEAELERRRRESN